MKTSWRIELPQLAVVAGLFVWSAVLWPSAPERMPVHFDIAGNVDRYGGKAEGLLLAPAVAFAVMGAGVLWTIVYSYLAFRDDPERFPAVSTRPE